MISSLSKYLEAQGVGVVGRDIFTRNMPYTVRRGILITEPLTGTMIDPELPDYYKTRINLIVRSQTYEDGLALAETLVDRLKLNETRMQAFWSSTCTQGTFLCHTQSPTVRTWRSASVSTLFLSKTK